MSRVTPLSFPSSTFSTQVFLSSSQRTYLKGGPVSNAFPAWAGRQCTHKRGHALGIQLTLLVHIHNIDLDEFSWRSSPDTEVEPRPEGQSRRQVIIYRRVEDGICGRLIRRQEEDRAREG